MIASPRPAGPRTLAARAEAARVPDGLAEVPRVLLLVPDPHARFAGVELDGRFFADEVLANGYGVCSYVFVWDVHRDVPSTLDDSLLRYAGRFGDLRMRPDLATLFPVPGALAVVCDVEWPDGEAVGIAPRTVLARQLAALEDRGLVPSIGIEHEVTFRGPDGEPLTEHPVDYALGGTERLRPVLGTAAGLLAGLGVESARAECHPGQYEIVLRHRDALAACDDALLQQFLVRQAAAEHGVTAGYAAAEGSGLGSSGHVHLSLSTLDGEPADRARLDSFLAGVLRHARALTPIWAPTWNSYVRLRTGPFSPRELRWGTDDRTASVRVAGGAAPRLEFRFAGADAQPHLVVAALLAAGCAGLDEQLAPPAEGESCGELAGSPWEALAEFTGCDLLGPEVRAQQLSLLRAEIDAGLESVSDWQRARARLRS